MYKELESQGEKRPEEIFEVIIAKIFPKILVTDQKRKTKTKQTLKHVILSVIKTKPKRQIKRTTLLHKEIQW